MRDAGYDVGADGDIPGLPATGRPAGDGDGDTLIHALIERGGQDPDWLTSDQLAGNPIRVPARQYREWFSRLAPGLAEQVVEHWGPPPGELFVDTSANPDGDIVIAALQAGNTVLLVQPPRGFGENPVAIYHDPDLPRVITTSPRTAGCRLPVTRAASAPTRWFTWASTETWNGFPGKLLGCRQIVPPMPRSAICR